MADDYSKGYWEGKNGPSTTPSSFAGEKERIGFANGLRERQELEEFHAKQLQKFWAERDAAWSVPSTASDYSYIKTSYRGMVSEDETQTPEALRHAALYKTGRIRKPMHPLVRIVALVLVAVGAWFGAVIKHATDDPNYVPTGRTLKIFTALTTARHVIETKWARGIAAVHGIEDKLSGSAAKNRDYTIEQDAKLASRSSVGLLVKTLDRREWPLLQFVHDRDPHENGPVKELLPKIHALDADYAQFVGENSALLMAAPGSSQAASHAWEIARDKFEKERAARIELNKVYVDRPLVSRLAPADSDRPTATNFR